MSRSINEILKFYELYYTFNNALFNINLLFYLPNSKMLKKYQH